MEDAGTAAAFAGIFGITIIFIIVIAIIWLVVIGLTIAGLWKMFKKAGEEGWKALIPFYNLYILCKLVGVTPWWLLIICISYVICSIPFIGAFASIVAIAAYYYFFIILGIGTARSYGKEDVWTVGFLLVPFIFYPLIGFKKEVEYLGVKEVKDPVWDWLVTTFGGSNKVPEAQVINEENNEAFKYCSKCGEKIAKDDKHCSKCGEKV